MLALSFYSLLALLEGLLLSSLKNINPGGLAVIRSLSARYRFVIRPPQKVGVLSRRFASFFQKRPSRLDGLQLLKLAFCVSVVPTFEGLVQPSVSPRRFATFGTLRFFLLRDVSGRLLVFRLDRPSVHLPARPSVHSLSGSFGVRFL